MMEFLTMPRELIFLILFIGLVDYFLGTTDIVKGNSIIECFLRSIGFLISKIFGLKMDKKKGVVKK